MSGTVKQFKTFRDLNKVSSTSTTSTPEGSSTSTSSTTSKPSTPRTTSRTRIPSSTSTTKEISPKKDYQKIPNSVTREAIPAGLFKGKSKVIYDYLWSLSRGAINPSRIAKVSRRQIKEKTAIGSMVTVDAALTHLTAVGLIQKASAIGSATGNNYEVFAPDELPSSTSIPSTSKITQKMDELDVLESSTSRQTQAIENITGYGNFKTLFKDFEPFDDDSPVYAAFLKLQQAAKAKTGKGLNRADWKAFAQLFELVIAETDLAVGRADSVSSYLALGVENLRRRLYPKKKIDKPKSSKREVKDVPTFEPEGVETLTDDVRETVLQSLRSVAEQNGREAVEFFKSNYTEEDWTWLMENL